MTHPSIRILEGHDRRLRGGSPWLFSNELTMDAAARAIAPGSIVRLVSHEGRAMAQAFFNPRSLIAARILTRNTDAAIDTSFLARRLRRALAIRDRLYDRPFYRLVHAEADGLPGLVVDRYGALSVVQVNSAGMELLAAPLAEALRQVLGPAAIVWRGDEQVRELEGLGKTAAPAGLDGAGQADADSGAPAEPVTIEENGLSYRVDPFAGQKTGWYYDQRANRAFVADLSAGLDVLDLYSYAGGFGLLALGRGATSALLVDRSAAALDLARASAELQGVADRVDLLEAEVFGASEALAADKRRFGLVIADPPPFVRSRKDLPAGLKGYQKLAKGAAGLVGEAGFLVIACCSHNVPEDEFLRAAYAGIRHAGRSATLLHRAGAGPDHPVHPALPESAYLKLLVFALD